MRALSKTEVTGFVQEARKLSAIEGTAILDQFERDQPQMYQAIFGELVDGIADENPEMANLFLDLCFDIIVVYKMAFGDPPTKARGKHWFNEKVALLDVELKSINKDISSSKFNQHLSNRFVERSIDAGIQLELLQHLDEQVNTFASFNHSRKKAIHFSNNLLFVVVRLMDDIYSPA